MKESGDRGYLRNVEPKNFDRVPVPEYKQAEPKPEIKITTLKDAAKLYLDHVKSGEIDLIETGLPELDHAIGGGAQYGEMFLLAARPSHGKSMCGLQMVHHWTWMGLPSAFISEEMSALSLGKRTVQFASGIHQDHWSASMPSVEKEVASHFSERKDCIVVEQCRTADAAAESIRLAVRDHGVKCVVVDYAQLLTSKGKGRYEQVTNTSIVLRQIANETKVLLVALCQLGRDIEKRSPMVPCMADLKDSGQLEQDADVIVFIVWPHRIDSNNDPHLFHFFIGKNRNREIRSQQVECRFDPSRQKLSHQSINEKTSVDYFN
jgi:replicative DNA helicase